MLRPALPIALTLFAGCQSGPATAQSSYRGDASAKAPLTALIEDLYRAFSFDADGVPDEPFLRRSFAEGATFVSPVPLGEVPKGQGTNPFLADFQSFVKASPLSATGYHERVTHQRVEQVGSIAHAWVTFEAFVPGEGPDRRGVDSIQFVLHPDGWKLVSFTTQYESDTVQLH